MTQSGDQSDEEYGGERNYASDRHLLLQEVQLLAREVAKLRGDTKYLRDVTVPREEHRRRRRVNTMLAGFSAFLFAITAAGLYVQGEDIRRTSDAQALATYERCLDQERQQKRQAPAFAAINNLLSTLMTAQENLAARPDATRAGRETASTQAQAYREYLAYVEKTVREAQVNAPAKPVSCETLKP